MRLLFLLLTTSTMFVACSAPKRGYFNSIHSTNTYATLPKTEATVRVQKETLMASSSKEILVQPAKIAGKNPRPTLSKITKSERKKVLRFGKGFKAAKNEFPDSVKVGDKSKNGFAIAGVTLAFSPLVGALVAATIAPGTGIGIVIGAVGFAIAMVFCSIGKKSELRKLAKAGITIMIIESILLVLGIVLALVYYEATK